MFSIAGHIGTKHPGRLGLAASILVGGVLVAGPASGNGALPGSLGIMLADDRPDEIVLATNFGLILSEDAGRTWLWTCEQPYIAMGYLYSVGPPPLNRLYALSPTEGLAYSDDGSCTWRRSGGVLTGAIASDYFVDRTDGNRVLAVAAQVDEEGGITPQSVYESADGGATFSPTPLYTAPDAANIVSIEIPRSNPDRIYVAMYRTPGRHPVLLRSDDRGRTWDERDVEAGVGENEFRILAVEGNDPDHLYLRVIALGMEMLAVTRDAGATITTPLTVAGGTLSGFTRLGDAEVFAAAIVGPDGFGYRSEDRGATFRPWTLDPQPHIVGLAARGGVLYLAGKNYSDNWAIARSRDRGATLEPLAEYADVRGIKPCAHATCLSGCEYEVSVAVWTYDVCTGALLDGGADGTPPVDGGGGCGCRAGGAGPVVPELVTLAATGLALVLAARRRRTRRGRD